jgi:predicted AAA+ superfamily ATPase
MSWQEQLSYKIKRYNPYEYLGPLNNLELFINREKELEDAFLVCDQVIRGSVGGVFVIGNRASGKTTFLKKLEIVLSQNDFIVIRIPLDERMVHENNEDQLFRTMIAQSIIKIRETDVIDQSLRDKILNFLEGFLN